jgi:hypothetical protein
LEKHKSKLKGVGINFVRAMCGKRTFVMLDKVINNYVLNEFSVTANEIADCVNDRGHI